jgi:hypothetical protein
MNQDKGLLGAETVLGDWIVLAISSVLSLFFDTVTLPFRFLFALFRPDTAK